MHYMNYVNYGYSGGPFMPAGFFPVFGLIFIWTIFWKIIALWNAAKRHEKWWFIALAVINTLGILEIVYIFGIAKIKLADLFKNF